MFLEAASPTYKGIFAAAVFTGLRRGELMALPWRNVTPSSVTVDRAWTRGGVISTPKTAASYRTVPIHPRLYEQLQALREHQKDSEWAFPSRTGTTFNEGNLGRAFRRAKELSGVPDIRFHDLRRTAATLWAEEGHPPKVIQKLLGHSTQHLALAIYTDVLEGQVLSAALDPGSLFGS